MNKDSSFGPSLIFQMEQMGAFWNFNEKDKRSAFTWTTNCHLPFLTSAVSAPFHQCTKWKSAAGGEAELIHVVSVLQQRSPAVFRLRFRSNKFILLVWWNMILIAIADYPNILSRTGAVTAERNSLKDWKLYYSPYVLENSL